MAFLGGLVGKLVAVAVGLLLLAGVAGVALYASDYGVEATVVEKDCAGGPLIVVKLELTGGHRTVPLDNQQQCAIIEIGNFVEYHVRTGHTRVYEKEGGKCVYDSQTGIGCGTEAFEGFLG